MFDDDLEPVHKKPKAVNLEPMSVGELEDYISDLRAEIERVQGEIERKKSQKNIADSVFK